MATRQFKVQRPFPVEWQKAEVKVGEIFQLLATDIWPEVGGAYFNVETPRTERPDFSGARIAWLLKNHYLEEPRQAT